MTASLAAGIVGGPVSGGLLSMNGVGGLAGWQWLFLLEGLPAIVLGVVVFFYMTEHPEDARWLSDDERSALVEALGRDKNDSPLSTTTIGGAFASGRIWVLAIVYFTIPIAIYAFGFWLPQIIRAASNGSDFQIGLLAAIPYVVGACGMVIVARHSDRTGERRWHIAGAAAAIALINSIGNTGGFVGPYVIGYIRDRTESFTGGLVFVGVVLAVMPLLVLVLPDDSRQPPCS